MELFEETERVKLQFIKAFRHLQDLGYFSEADLEEVIDALDRLDTLTDEEFEAKLGKFKLVRPLD